MVTNNEALAWLNSQVGQHLDYDHAYGQQCVDFFNFYYQYCTGDNPYTDGYGVNGAKDLWNVPNSMLLKLPDSPSLKPQPGDIVVYGASWGGGYGHVEIVVSIDSHGCAMIGENEHNNPNEGVVSVYRTWAQMRGLIGIMRFHWTIPQTVPKYTVTETYPDGKLIKLNKQPTYLWGMNYDFDFMANHPIETHDAGEIWTVTNKVHHVDGYDYYRRDGQVDGFNVLDCDDYVPQLPVPDPVPVSTPLPVGSDSTATQVSGSDSGASGTADASSAPSTPTTPSKPVVVTTKKWYQTILDFILGYFKSAFVKNKK